MQAHWYVLNVKPHKERIVNRFLRSKEVEVYFPTLRVQPVNPRASTIRPYFPGYLFVRLDLQDRGKNALRWTPGTRGLVRFGSEPAMVPDALISELRERVAEANEMRDDPELQSGDRVRITGGPFEGYEGLFDTYLSGHDRAQILLAFLHNHPQRLKINTDDLQKVE